MNYYISDCHFFHKSLNHSMDNRGFATVEEMNEYMIEKWNAKVRNKDEVFILGDLSYGNAEETNWLLDRLNGKLHLIEGNHDGRYLNRGGFDRDRFKWVKAYAETHDNGYKVVMCHYPIVCYSGQYIMNKEGQPKTYMLYGHVHDTHDEQLVRRFQTITRDTVVQNREGQDVHLQSNMINCFCMYSDYEPLSLEEWIDLYNNQVFTK